ncbi:MAG: ester cyclase [Chloroflexi bacterium]|nr:ester cyclase [Chloroflexota bacterium]
MLDRETMRRVLQEHVDAENACDRDRVLATYVEHGAEFVDVPAGRTYTDSDAIIDNYRNLWDGFPGLVRRIGRWTFGDDACVIELTLTGTHDGPYRGIAATGRKLELPIAAHFQFDPASGRIKRETAYYDTLTFRRQLGIT